MLEKTLRFFQREQYVAPEYKEQIEQFHKKQKEFLVKRDGSFSQFRTSGLKALDKQDKIDNYEEGIQHGQKIFFPLLFACAIASDFADAFPVIGTIIKIIALSVIWYNILIKGSSPGYLDQKYQIQVSWKVRLFFRILGLVDLIPLINALPLTTLSVLIIWHKNRKQIEAMKDALQNAESDRGAYASQLREVEA